MELVCFVHGVYALDPNKAISQYIHDVWGAENGYTAGTIYAIAQTPDGYLWIGTEKGLVRFDGVQFKIIQPVNSNLVPTEPVIGLLADDRGDLWIQLYNQDILRFRNNSFENVLIDPNRIKLPVTVINKSKNGEILFSTLHNGIFKYNGNEIYNVIAESEMPKSNVISLASTSSGDIWLGTRDKGLSLYRENEHRNIINGLPNVKINCLLSDSEQELLIGTDQGIVRWNGTEFIAPAGLKPLEKSQISALFKDRDANFWIATNADGIWRLSDGGVVSSGKNNPQFNSPVTAIFEDREGNIWFGTSRGLERLRESAFTTYSDAEGIPAENKSTVFVDEENTTWFAPESGGLYFLQDSKINKIALDGIAHDIIYSITGSHQDLWLGRQTGGLTHLHLSGASYASETFTQSDGLAQNNVYAVYQAGDKSIWAGTLSGGVSHLKDGKFKNYTTADGLALNAVTAIAEGSDGTMWFATPAGISAFNGVSWQTLKSNNGLPSDNTNSLLADSQGVLWIGTEKGLAFYNANQIQIPANLPASLNENILGMAEDKQGALWIATSNRVLQVNRNSLLKGTINNNDIREFGLADGLKSVEGVKRNRSVIADSGGRIWFSLKRGISMVDPNRLKDLSVPALVQIQNVSTGDISLNLRNPISISSGQQKITVKFAALSLSIPERIKYRYQLEGFDKEWSAPSTAIESAYTNLAPGTYRFRVIATNSEGLWNSTEAAIIIKITPVYWQTWWFLILCLTASTLLIMCLFRLRVYHLRNQMEARFEERLEERLAERQRIAHELHDTLLQGVYSASIQLDFVIEELVKDSSIKPILNRVLQLLGQVMDEGRQTLKGLQSGKSDKLFILEETFSQLKEDFDRSGQTDFQITVKGATQTINPLVRDEIYRIGREAIINSFRHSKASNIKVEIDYAPKYFKLMIRDNGIGLDPATRPGERDGHFGLSGMRLSAERIGAKLDLPHSSDDGLSVELTVPDYIAYENQLAGSLSKWLDFLRPGSRTKSKTFRERGKTN